MPFAGVALFVAWRMNRGFPPLAEMLGSSWGSSLFNPLAALSQLAISIGMGNFMSILKVVIIGIGLAAIFWLFRRKQIALSIYQAGLLIYLVSFTVPNHPLGSFIRYFLLSFPVFMALGVWLQSKRWLGTLSFSFLAAVNLLLCSFYLAWIFVA